MHHKKNIIRQAINMLMLAIGFICISFELSSQYINYSNSVSESKRIIYPTPGEFPIVASTVFNSLVGPKEGDLEMVKECGFNVCMDYGSDAQFDSLLRYMDETGLKLLLQSSCFMYDSKDDLWKRSIPAFVNRYKGNSCVAGWKFLDEPKWEKLAELKERYELLLATDNTHFVSINLVGMLEKDFTGPCKTLGEYADTIQKVFNPGVWSSDYYPIMIRNGQFIVNYDGFYTDLDTYSQKSKETGVPMWSYCESMEFKSKHHDVPAATVPYLSFEAFSALAYGAQGIVYWTYWQRPSNSYETYVSALVDLDGNKTPAWYAAQTVNRQIRALTPVFLGAQMEEVRHSGNIPLKDIRPFVSDFGPIDRLTNGDKGVLVSHLTNNGSNYIVIVNHDVQNKQSIRIKFKDDVKGISRIEVSTSGTLTQKNVKGLQKETLTPGGYVIYQWQ